MSKKQTTNTFGKGMMLDLHPLTVPSDVLTDALNATTITMNGNEGILQNDMGNGRVESAFLPPGYVPVGIKEYGGIIYVASYNPVTNKSQIGSFPSPERNIDLTEDGLLKTPLELLNDTYTRTYKCSTFNTIYDGLNLQIGLGLLSNKVEIFGDYKIIRSGDKFGFYFDNSEQTNDVNSLSNYFSFNNAEENKRKLNIFFSENENKPPFSEVGGWDEENNVYQNNIITLSTQVLDSNNNLRDLTPLLKRYDNENNPIKFTAESAEDKFNSGYFISSNKNSDWDPVSLERNKSALNTYNNKLFGKLYLVGKVNVIDHIDVLLVTKSYIDESLAEYNSELTNGDSKSNVLYFYIDYYYNCPVSKLHPPKLYCAYNGNITGNMSGYIRLAEPIEYSYNEINVVSSGERYDSYIEFCENLNCNNYHKGDKIYNNYENESIPKFSSITEEPIQYDISDSEDPELSITVLLNTTTIKSWNPENPTYDPLTNLYRLRYFAYVVLNNSTYSLENVDSTILNYLIIPRMTGLPGEGSNSKLLTHIAVEGSIDLSKIGSGKCNITTWRYICTDNMVKLNWGLEDYPLDTDVIEDMRMDFYDWNNKDELLTDLDESVLSHPTSDWYLMFNQISYNSVNTSITFDDNTLKKRHIYIVKLSRKKNGNYESIGWRILITTPIYNDLFMIYDDYCYNGKDDTLKNNLLRDIKDRNNIKLDFNVSIKQFTKSNSNYSTKLLLSCNIRKFSVDIPGGTAISIPHFYKISNPENKSGWNKSTKLYEGKNYYAYYKNTGDIYSENDFFPDSTDEYTEISDFTTVKTLKDLYTYIYTLYTEFNTTRDIEVTPKIPDIYPFEFLNEMSGIKYKVNYESNIVKNILDKMIGGTIDDSNNSYQYDNNISNDRYYSISDHINVLNYYLFPSNAIYKYKNTLKTIVSNHTYESLYNFIYKDLSGLSILFPFIGGHDNSGKGRSYFDLLGYNYDSQEIERYYYDSIMTIDGKGQHYRTLSSYSKIINEILQNSGLENNTFIVIGSPITFGLNIWDNLDKDIGGLFKSIIGKVNLLCREINDTIEDGAKEFVEYSSSGTGNFMLRRDEYPYKADTDSSLIMYDLNDDPDSTNKKWLEKGDTKPTHAADKFAWGLKDWFILLWKNKDGKFTAINYFYGYDNVYLLKKNKSSAPLDNQTNFPPNSYFSESVRKIENLGDNILYPNDVIGDRGDKKDWIINSIFGEYAKDLFFKLNRSGELTGYFIDKDNIIYNTDYTVEIEDILKLKNILFDENLLKYYESEKLVDSDAIEENNFSKLIIPIIEIINNTTLLKVINDTNSSKLAEINENLSELLEFNLVCDEIKVNIDTNTYNIQGMDNFVNNINVDNCEGFIEKGDNKYTLDSTGSDLIGNIYVIEDNKPVLSNFVSKHRGFVNSLDVQNDELIISNYKTNQNKHYAFSYGNRSNGDWTSELVVKIDFPYIDYRAESNSGSEVDSFHLIFGET